VQQSKGWHSHLLCGGPGPYFSCPSRNTTGVTEEALKEFSMMFK
jgi:hypothetical protein